MDSTELERRKRVMSQFVDDIAEHKRWFAARGIDVSDPVDRETVDEFKRLERQMRAKHRPTDAYQEAGE